MRQSSLLLLLTREIDTTGQDCAAHYFHFGIRMVKT
jgi:hypothetical protein